MTIKIRLTKEQMKQLEPVFANAEKHPMKGIVIGQALETGIAAFKWMTPEQVIEDVEKTARKYRSNLIEPAK